MQRQGVRIVAAALACLALLAGCQTWSPTAGSGAANGDPETTGSIAPAEPMAPGSELVPGGPVAGEPNDDLNLGKRHYREQNYGLAEKHYRRAVESPRGPVERDAEAWLGLAASYDQLRRYDLADRAYDQAIKLVGPKPEILNNQGYSYLSRGDFRRARGKLADARAKDPQNPTILANIDLLERAERTPAKRR